MTPGMKVADLLRMARNPISEAYLGRAALKRWNGDNTTTLIPIDLAKAIENDPQNNIPLMKWDSLEMYSRSEAAFVGTRKIEVRGAVQRRRRVRVQPEHARLSTFCCARAAPCPMRSASN